jgi:hypothetical protein
MIQHTSTHPHIHTSTHPHIHTHYSAVNYHSYSFTRSLRSFVCSFVASPVHSYGVNARVIFVVGGLPPLLVYRTKFPSLGGGPPPYWSIERSFRRLVADPPLLVYRTKFPSSRGGTPADPPQTIPRDHNTV